MNPSEVVLLGGGSPLIPNIEENCDWDRTLTKYLYGGDNQYRLAQWLNPITSGFNPFNSSTRKA